MCRHPCIHVRTTASCLKHHRHVWHTSSRCAGSATPTASTGTAQPTPTPLPPPSPCPLPPIHSPSPNACQQLPSPLHTPSHQPPRSHLERRRHRPASPVDTQVHTQPSQQPHLHSAAAAEQRPRGGAEESGGGVQAVRQSRAGVLPHEGARGGGAGQQAAPAAQQA